MTLDETARAAAVRLVERFGMAITIRRTASAYDPATKTMTGWFEGPDMTGQVSKMKSISVMKDPETRVFSMYNVGSDGKETLGMRITYTKKK